MLPLSASLSTSPTLPLQPTSSTAFLLVPPVLILSSSGFTSGPKLSSLPYPSISSVSSLPLISSSSWPSSGAVTSIFSLPAVSSSSSLVLSQSILSSSLSISAPAALISSAPSVVSISSASSVLPLSSSLPASTRIASGSNQLTLPGGITSSSCLQQLSLSSPSYSSQLSLSSPSYSSQLSSSFPSHSSQLPLSSPSYSSQLLSSSPSHSSQLPLSSPSYSSQLPPMLPTAVVSSVTDVIFGTSSMNGTLTSVTIPPTNVVSFEATAASISTTFTTAIDTALTALSGHTVSAAVTVNMATDVICRTTASLSSSSTMTFFNMQQCMQLKTSLTSALSSTETQSVESTVIHPPPLPLGQPTLLPLPPQPLLPPTFFPPSPPQHSSASPPPMSLSPFPTMLSQMLPRPLLVPALPFSPSDESLKVMEISLFPFANTQELDFGNNSVVSLSSSFNGDVFETAPGKETDGITHHDHGTERLSQNSLVEENDLVEEVSCTRSTDKNLKKIKDSMKTEINEVLSDSDQRSAESAIRLQISRDCPVEHSNLVAKEDVFSHEFSLSAEPADGKSKMSRDSSVEDPFVPDPVDGEQQGSTCSLSEETSLCIVGIAEDPNDRVELVIEKNLWVSHSSISDPLTEENEFVTKESASILSSHVDSDPSSETPRTGRDSPVSDKDVVAKEDLNVELMDRKLEISQDSQTDEVRQISHPGNFNGGSAERRLQDIRRSFLGDEIEEVVVKVEVSDSGEELIDQRALIGQNQPVKESGFLVKDVSFVTEADIITKPASSQVQINEENHSKDHGVTEAKLVEVLIGSSEIVDNYKGLEEKGKGDILDYDYSLRIDDDLENVGCNAPVVKEIDSQLGNHEIQLIENIAVSSRDLIEKKCTDNDGEKEEDSGANEEEIEDCEKEVEDNEEENAESDDDDILYSLNESDRDGIGETTTSYFLFTNNPSPIPSSLPQDLPTLPTSTSISSTSSSSSFAQRTSLSLLTSTVVSPNSRTNIVKSRFHSKNLKDVLSCLTCGNLFDNLHQLERHLMVYHPVP